MQPFRQEGKGSAGGVRTGLGEGDFSSFPHSPSGPVLLSCPVSSSYSPDLGICFIFSCLKPTPFKLHQSLSSPQRQCLWIFIFVASVQTICTNCLSKVLCSPYMLSKLITALEKPTDLFLCLSPLLLHRMLNLWCFWSPNVWGDFKYQAILRHQLVIL